MGRKLSVILIIASASVLFNVLSCSKSGSENTDISCSGTPGPLFLVVKKLVEERCISCHNASILSGGRDFTIECNIVINRDRIKIRVVDEGSMPQTGALAQADKDKITAWVNAGGGYNN